MSFLRGLAFVLSFFLIGAGQAHAQPAAQYNFSAFGGTYTQLAGATAVTGIQQDDAVVHNIPIGFTFNFCGIGYQQLSVSSNGWLKFGSNTGTVNQLTNSLATLVDVTPGVQPLWDDIDGTPNLTPPSFSGYLTTGTAPNRVFTFEWRNWQWNYISSTGDISFQVKLYETSGIIDFIYQPGTTTPTTPSASIGIAGSSTDYKNLNNSSTAPVASSTAFTTTIATAPANGQVYRWAPGITAPYGHQQWSGMHGRPGYTFGYQPICQCYLYIDKRTGRDDSHIQYHRHFHRRCKHCGELRGYSGYRNGPIDGGLHYRFDRHRLRDYGRYCHQPDSLQHSYRPHRHQRADA